MEAMLEAPTMIYGDDTCNERSLKEMIYGVSGEDDGEILGKSLEDVDLGKLSESEVRKIVLESTKFQLLTIPSHKRGDNIHPWVDYMKIRFGEEKMKLSEKMRFLGGCRRFYLLLLLEPCYNDTLRNERS